jgi:hypothetical protein
MTPQTIKELSDPELVQVIAWAQQEQQERATQRKQETIAKIRELARSIEIHVKVEGTRGRPAKISPKAMHSPTRSK